MNSIWWSTNHLCLSMSLCFILTVQESLMLEQRQSAALLLNAAPASRELSSGLAHSYINSCGEDWNSGGSVHMLLDY